MQDNNSQQWQPTLGTYSPFSGYGHSAEAEEQLELLRLQVKILESLEAEYGHKTLTNVLQGLRKRIECITHKPTQQ